MTKERKEGGKEGGKRKTKNYVVGPRKCPDGQIRVGDGNLSCCHAIRLFCAWPRSLVGKVHRFELALLPDRLLGTGQLSLCFPTIQTVVGDKQRGLPCALPLHLTRRNEVGQNRPGCKDGRDGLFCFAFLPATRQAELPADEPTCYVHFMSLGLEVNFASSSMDWPEQLNDVSLGPHVPAPLAAPHYDQAPRGSGLVQARETAIPRDAPASMAWRGGTPLPPLILCAEYTFWVKITIHRRNVLS